MLIDSCRPAQYAFGPRTGLWVVVPFQVIVMVGEYGHTIVDDGNAAARK
jgi:hypothetical protein